MTMATKPINLPISVIQALRDRYLAGVDDAQAGFEDARADEDSLTGALGQELSRRPLMTVFDGSSAYELKTFRFPMSCSRPLGVVTGKLLNDVAAKTAKQGLSPDA